ncbi:MAG: cytochrome d ubiquinol oxidase subunit II [Myxococcota bacterium]|nr:cytochrome d ubiquinol oxidase subunit II [Myxococcota bacterium]
MDHETLAVIWFALLGVLLAGYAILDGFDLGVGIMHLLIPRDDRERRLCLNSIGPLWDGNEVWLVVFGAGMLAAFPEAYASIFSGFYTAFMLLLYALIFRAVSIEFRSKRPGSGWRRFWDTNFSLGSGLATFLFGVAIGNVMIGIPLDERGDFVGTFVGLLNPYALSVGLLVVAMFAMHGTIYLNLKTEGELQQRTRPWMWRTFAVFLALYVVVTLWTLVAVPRATANLSATPVLWLIPVGSAIAVANIPRAVHRGAPGGAFVGSCIAIVALVFLLGAALYPNLVVSNPNPELSLTVFESASSQKTLGIMLLIAVIGMPVVLTYTFIVYWTFRGKVKLEPESY